MLRPDVVWFGEQLHRDAWRRAIEAAQAGDVFLSVGTSTVVQPAASLPLQAAQSGAVTVEINLRPTPISSTIDYVLPGPAGEVRPALIKAAWPTN